MAHPLATIVMPIHNAGSFLERTLESVANEAGTKIAIKIFDSSDDPAETLRLVGAFADRLAIEFTYSAELKKWQSKVNAGFVQAETSHVVVLHQDDLWLPGHLDAVETAVTRYCDASLSIGPSRFIDEKDNYIGLWGNPYSPGVVSGRAFAEKLLVQNSLAVPSVIYRRDAWLAAGGMDETLWYTPDWDIYLKLARIGNVHVRSSPTTAFRLHGSSLTVSGSADVDAFSDQLIVVLDRHLVAWDIDEKSAIARRARASVRLNVALAQVLHGRKAAIVQALAAALQAMLAGPRAFMRETRIFERLLPRLFLLRKQNSEPI